MSQRSTLPMCALAIGTLAFVFVSLMSLMSLVARVGAMESNETTMQPDGAQGTQVPPVPLGPLVIAGDHLEERWIDVGLTLHLVCTYENETFNEHARYWFFTEGEEAPGDKTPGPLCTANVTFPPHPTPNVCSHTTQE